MTTNFPRALRQQQVVQSDMTSSRTYFRSVFVSPDNCSCSYELINIYEVMVYGESKTRKKTAMQRKSQAGDHGIIYLATNPPQS